MLVTHDGKHAVIADPDRDRLMVVDLGSQDVKESPLTTGDEPGRLIEDAAGRIHVALRRGGALLTMDGSKITRRAACAEPRGLAYDATTDLVHMACATGELISFPASGGDAVRNIYLDRDLRDVIVSGTGLIVTRFRTAELITLDATGAIVSRATPPDVERFNGIGIGGGGPIQVVDAGTGMGSGSGGTNPDGSVNAVAAVAWRTIALSDGRLVMAHQRHSNTMLMVEHGGYGQGCNGNGPDEAAISMMAPGQAPVAVAPQIFGALPVDVAVDPTNTRLAFVMAGKNAVDIVPTTTLDSRDNGDGCGGMGGGDGGNGSGQDLTNSGEVNDQLGAPTSVAFNSSGDLVVFYPEYPAIVIHPATGTAKTIPLPGELGYDAGRSMFHQQTQSGLACASCHPEARDDGQVWQFENEGARRTQNLAGRIMDRAPYHWAGDMADLPTLMDDVFAVRMAGPTPTHSEHLALGPFLDRVAPPAAPVAPDAAAVARGQTLFEATDTNCTMCHRGSLYSTKALVDVGTGGTFKVPSLLGVGNRAPYMHDGCAKTLADRFVAPCGGGDTHGHTSQLTAAQVSDLVAFLNTL